MYHEISKDSLESVLHEGLKCASRGKLGKDSDIIAADRFLDERRPTHLKQAGICRNNNIYCFVGDEISLINIKDGRRVLLDSYNLNTNSTLLKVAVDSSVCYVSDLDLYDNLKDTLHNHHVKIAEKLASKYWHNVTPLSHFTSGDISRPEILVTCNIGPAQISIVKQS